ncbi:MAG: PEGA domain-containing protein [Bryobacteraceae bacterium]|nr:PEGA domain-containing protein [Bryobacteraceae bacterium]
MMAEGMYEEAVSLLRQAGQIDPSNAEVRSALTAALQARAVQLAGQNSPGAGAALDELLKADPANETGLRLRADLGATERDQFVEWCTGQAAKLQAIGEVDGAKAILQQGLFTYPEETRLKQAMDSLSPATPPPAPKSAREKDLDLLRSLDVEASTVTAADSGRITTQVDAIEISRFDDAECSALVASIREKIARARAAQAPPPPQPAPPVQSPSAPLFEPPAGTAPPQAETLFGGPPEPPSPPLFSEPTPSGGPGSSSPDPFFFGAAEAASPPPSSSPAPAGPPTPAAPPAQRTASRPSAAAKKASNTMRNAFIGAAVLIVLVSLFALWRRSVSTGDAVEVEIRTTPPGARIVIGGETKGTSNLTLRLQPGDYQISAELDGYEPVVTPLNVQSGVPTGVGLILNPWRPSVRVYSDLELSGVTLSGRPMNPGAAGEFVVDSLNDGNYDLALTGPQATATVGLQLAGNSMPAIAAAIDSKSADILLIHTFRDQITIHSNIPSAQASMDGGEARPLAGAGAVFSGISLGSHQVTISDGTASRTIPVSVSGGAPVVQAFILSKGSAGTGSVLIATGEDQVIAKVNGYRHWLKSRNGQIRIGSLKPGTYKIEVLKDGFESPPAASVEVKAGEETKVALRVRAVVRLAAVTITGPAGAQVVIDNAPAGSIPAGGSLTLDLPPGQHSFELRRNNVRSAAVTRTLRPGEPVSIGASDLAFPQPATGIVRFEVTPAGSRMTLRRRGEAESQAQAVTQTSMTLQEGAYILSVSAPGHASTVVNFQVTAGSNSSVPVALRALAAQAEKQAPPPRGIQDFADISSWIADGQWRVRRGGNFVLYSTPPSNGTVQFSFQLRRGKEAVWVVNYKDPRNHVRYRVDDKQVVRSEVVNGRERVASQVPHGFANLDEFEVRIVIEDGRIRQELRQGGAWTAADQFQGSGLGAGRFGFFVSGRGLGRADEYAVKDFVFRPAAQ